ncbi:hypothetical protein BKA56DRAFT_499600 [Ilyonectria sp. MPI-CAGE-AT-0026]|nr:hypothetical protein BKA56DRAFT_499600 [Ilyonectria sp. MPI-CAGE-AT-0026]
MVTPPPSTPPSQIRSGSPRKRRRPHRRQEEGEGTDGGDESSHLEEDPDKTPSASSSSVLSVASCRLPLRSVPLVQSSPSISQSSTSQTSSIRKSTRRSASPVKTFTLQMLRKPVEFVELADNPDAQLPIEIRQLYRDIYDLAVDRERFIPKGLKKAVQGRVPGVKARYFSEQDEPYDSSTASRELEILLEIKADAQLCRSSNASEAAWNSDVHSPLLKIALKPSKKPLLRRHVLTSSRISPAFIPPMQEGSCYDVAGSKMVDYGIALHPEDGDPLDLSIRRALAHLPVHSHHLNQTAYDPIRFAANAVSIETKTGANGLQEARLQVGIWIAAWYTRMQQLLRRTMAQEEETQDEKNDQEDGETSGKIELLIPVPVVIVIEHEWKLFFACDRGNKIDIIGHITIGDTKSLDGLFIIVAVIRRLATWIQDDFRTWLEKVLT